MIKPTGINNEARNTSLFKNTVNALFRWGKAGFSIVEAEILERRENACLTCENLIKPQKLLQKTIVSKATNTIGKRAADSICKLCGCSISKKIRLTSESCPEKHQENLELTRWGEIFNKK